METISHIMNSIYKETFKGLISADCRVLILTRKHWENNLFEENGFSFTKEELDNAEKSETKLIGFINNCACYLTNRMI